MGVSRAGGKDLLLSLPACPAQGEGEGGSGGLACRSPCLSLSFGVCNMGVTMQYPAQVLWEADTKKLDYICKSFIRENA